MRDSNIEENRLKMLLIDLIKNILSKIIKLPKEQLDENALFEEFGIDSISSFKMTEKLEEIFGVLPKTLFFEYSTISELADYFVGEYREKIEKMLSYNSNTSSMKSRNSSNMKSMAIEKMSEKICEIVSKNTKLPVSSISPDTSFEECGVDSILALRMTDELESYFDVLPKTLFFEYRTIKSMSEYFVNNYYDTVVKVFSTSNTKKSSKVHNLEKKKPNYSDESLRKEANNNSSDMKSMAIEKMSEKICEIVSKNTKLPVSSISPDTSFEECGVDSIMALKMTDEFEEIFGILPKTLFFDYGTISELADYFVEEYSDKIEKMLLNKSAETADLKKNDTKKKAIVNRITNHSDKIAAKTLNVQDDLNNIAIIGIAVKAPQADNVEEFWKNLCEGKDCITQIPEERFSIKELYNPDKNASGNIYAKWGGFINGVDEFDPMFFNISPKDAPILDPQVRLFLECAYSAIEDAGYSKDNIGDKNHDVGVFAGAIYEEYQLYAVQEQQKGNPISVDSSLSSIANQVSYFCNFVGPSITLDTMCSSSMTALHLACNSIKLGECSVAIAGGVNISIHPNKYLRLSASNFLSTNGRCTSFGKGGDGFVPSEGVGVVILKPLYKAINDRDHIYGVIKGTAVNHGGKTNGFTVPSSNAQSDVINKALKQAKVDPRTVSYVEAHGTGTSLGDPIEINGLTKAFKEYTNDTQFCYIGSLKSNIGHCEGAAGILGLIKVLLQLKYKKIVPSIHSDVLNPYIEFEKTPFVVSRSLIPWERPKINNVTYPRISEISSFGAGGSNSHVIIEEYNDEGKPETYNENATYVILLSAKRKDRLDEYASKISDYLENHDLSDNDLPAIASCLQFGREAMDYRLGFTVSSINELKEKFKLLAEHKEFFELYTGNKSENMEVLYLLQQFSMSVIDELFENERYDKLINAWTKGIDIDWSRLYNGEKPYKISFPTYPFAKEKYWYTDIKLKSNVNLAKVVTKSEPEHLEETIKPTRIENKQKSFGNFTKNIEEDIKKLINEAIEVPIDYIENYMNFSDLGFNSIGLIDFSVMLSEMIQEEIKPDVFYSYYNVKMLVEYLINNYHDNIVKLYGTDNKSVAHPEEENSEEKSNSQINKEIEKTTENKTSDNNIEVAIVGISGRFPGADNVDELWEILKNGKETIGFVSDSRTEWKKAYIGEDRAKINARKIGAISCISDFDPAFFEISPREAINMDPKQRILLEEMWKALEDAGYSDKSVEDNMCVFVGAEESDYHELTNEVNITANHNAVLSARLAYFLNVSGANMTINTACSSGLVAFHQAFLNIRSGESDSAVVGAANILPKPEKYLAMEEAGMTSKDGKCYAFDKRANGMVPAEAVVAIVLKRLDKAIEDGNTIYATVAGSGVNYDGKTNGITAPSGISQINLITTIYDRFKINPEDISYVVAHGTGTNLGDPIESNALYNSFRKFTDKSEYCALTSNKPNIGHALAASGLVSLINLILAMKHETIPASINSEEANDYINWNNSPFYINHKNKKWQNVGGKLRLGAVSAFGMSGTNAHVVIRDYVNEEHNYAKVKSHLFVFSAKNEESLINIIREYKHYFEAENYIENDQLQSISYTLINGRSHFQYRCAIVADDYYSAIELLRKAENKTPDTDIMWSKVNKNFEATEDILEKLNSLKKRIVENNDLREYHISMGILAEFYIKGCNDVWYGEKRQLLHLPTYPFLKKLYWPKAKSTDIKSDFPVRHEKATEKYEINSSDISKKEKSVVEKKSPAISNISSEVKKTDSDVKRNSNSKLIKLADLNEFRNIAYSNTTIGPVAKIKLRSFDLYDNSSIRKNDEIKVDNESESVDTIKNEKTSSVDIRWLINELIGSLAEELYCQPDEIDVEDTFTEIGLDSIIGVEWISKLNKKYNLNLKTTKLYQYTNILEFIEALAKLIGNTNDVTEKVQNRNKETLKTSVDANGILNDIVKSLSEELYIDMDDMDLENSFTEMGLDSIIGVEWISKINKKYSLNIKTTKLYSYSTAYEFIKSLVDEITHDQSEILIESNDFNSDSHEKTVVDNSYKNESLIESLIKMLAEELYMDESEIDVDASFMELGLDSIIGVEWINKVNKKFGIHLNTTKLYQYSNIVDFSKYVSSIIKDNGSNEEIAMEETNKYKNDKSTASDDSVFEKLLSDIYNGNINVDDAMKIANNL